MQKAYLLILMVFILFACRKDNSTSLKASSGDSVPVTKGSKCLIITSKDPTGSGTTVKYQLDSILLEGKNSVSPDENFYLIQETSKKFLYAKGTNSLANVKYRLYLNSDGAVEKEVKVNLNSDGKTFTEDASYQNIYTYNSKKQLTKFKGALTDDVSIFDLTYDEKNRIKEILVYDEMNTLYSKYDNFTHSSTPINNNFFAVTVTESIGSYFIPSLRNTYITHYNMSYPGSGLATDSFDFDYKFKNGALSQIVSKYNVFGFPIEFAYNVTLSCK